jgi:hypothetical protein
VTGEDRKGHEGTGADTSGHLFLEKFIDENRGRKMRDSYEWSGNSEAQNPERGPT